MGLRSQRLRVGLVSGAFKQTFPGALWGTGPPQIRVMDSFGQRVDEKPSDTKDRKPLETLVHVPGRGTWPSRGSGQTTGLKSGHAGACRGADGLNEDSRGRRTMQCWPEPVGTR